MQWEIPIIMAMLWRNADRWKRTGKGTIAILAQAIQDQPPRRRVMWNPVLCELLLKVLSSKHRLPERSDHRKLLDRVSDFLLDVEHLLA